MIASTDLAQVVDSNVRFPKYQISHDGFEAFELLVSDVVQELVAQRRLEDFRQPKASEGETNHGKQTTGITAIEFNNRHVYSAFKCCALRH
jgi:hypothetical protein